MNGDVYSVPCVKRFIELKARKYGLKIDEYRVKKNRAGLITNRNHINDMILIGLNTDFYGGGRESIAEQAHTIDVNRPEEGIRYIVRGLIDKTFLERNDKNEVETVEIVDYKSSKQKFYGDKIKFNMQGVIYQFFIKDLFPTAKSICMKFLFLQFPRSPWQPVEPIPDRFVKGIEIHLTRLFHKINNFTEKDAKSHFAKHHGLSAFCGKKGMKTFNLKEYGKVEAPEVNWICPYKEPYNYFVLLGEGDKIIKSAMTKGELIPKEGQKVEPRTYSGCPAFHASKKDLKKFLGAAS